ncbi:flagellar brake protein [Romboutsia sp.]|uniref:flagellar brake protein n=1 Tax=Romboutsia sp. TaxID=1965302 RepID=UPI003F320DC7
MAFDIFKKKKEEAIQQSLNKYKKVLHDDMSLSINITYAKKMYIAEIETLKNREVVFRLPAEARNIVNFKTGQAIKVDFVSGRGLFTTKLNITNKVVENYNTYYTGTICDTIEKNQRRNNYRLPLTLNVTYVLLPNELRTYNGVTKDISAGGMLMESSYYVNEDRKIKVFFELDKKMYRLDATIVRSVENIDNERYLHHVRFDYKGTKEKNEIAKFIFNEERREFKSKSRSRY